MGIAHYILPSFRPMTLFAEGHPRTLSRGPENLIKTTIEIQNLIKTTIEIQNLINYIR